MTKPSMRIFAVLRLLLDVFGAVFLGLMLISVAVYGVLPYAAFMRLGSLMFYALLAAAFVVWLSLAARELGREPDPPER